jgi:hypothetical protein
MEIASEKLIRTDENTTRTEESRTDCVGHTILYVPPDLGGADYHLLLRTFGGQCPSFKDHRIEFAMKRSLLSADITFTQPYQGLWLMRSPRTFPRGRTGHGICVTA